MSRQPPSKSCVTITTAIALAFCMRIWMTGVFGLIDSSNKEGEWLKVDALIVGSNNTSTFFASYADDNKMYFCPRVEFTNQLGENITAISDTDCVLDALTIDIGSYVPIFYNPAYPREFIEQEVLETELVSLKIMVGVGIPVSLILSGVLCLLLNRTHRRQPPQYMQESSMGTSTEPTERSEERKARILSKLHTVTVLEDTNSTLASSIRSRSKLDSLSDKKTKEATGDTEALPGNNEEKNRTDADENDVSESNPGESSSSEPKHRQASNSTMSFLSSLIRPSHDAECCICLDHYEQGEIICASKSEECNHVFHKECLMDWMMKNNDRCPLCRVDFMKDDADDAHDLEA
ncbi:MAG: hypothetical protein SGBAC_006682 [Bacillariaceae sp.]